MRKHSGGFRSRRELFAGAMRYATLGLMVAASAALFAKRQRLVRKDQCTSSGICVGCKVLEQCGLPKALSAKRTLAGVDNDKK